jgi:hypothetical protein
VVLVGSNSSLNYKKEKKKERENNPVWEGYRIEQVQVHALKSMQSQPWWICALATIFPYNGTLFFYHSFPPLLLLDKS